MYNTLFYSLNKRFSNTGLISSVTADLFVATQGKARNTVIELLPRQHIRLLLVYNTVWHKIFMGVLILRIS